MENDPIAEGGDGIPCVRIMGGMPYAQVARAILEAGGIIGELRPYPNAEVYAPEGG